MLRTCIDASDYQLIMSSTSATAEFCKHQWWYNYFEVEEEEKKDIRHLLLAMTALGGGQSCTSGCEGGDESRAHDEKTFSLVHGSRERIAPPTALQRVTAF